VFTGGHLPDAASKDSKVMDEAKAIGKKL